MKLNIFTQQVENLVNEFNQAQAAAAGNSAALKSNFRLYQAKAEELSKNILNDQPNIPNVALDLRKALYKLTLMIEKMKAGKETSITLASNY